MLYPQENKIRGIIDFNGVWDFALGTTEEPKDTVTLPDQMEPIAVPASYNDQKEDIAFCFFFGASGVNGCRTLRNFCAFVFHLLLVGQQHYGLHHSLYYVFYLPAVWLFMGSEEFVVYLGRSAFPLIPALVCRCTGIFADYSRAYTEL